MGIESHVDVVNQHGWRKSFTVQKNIVHIGSDERNDIVLAGDDNGLVAPRHAQLVPSPTNRQGFRLINLSDSPIEIWPNQLPTDGEALPLGPRDTAEILGGDCAQIGSFRLKFQGGEQQSDLLAIRASIPNKKLLHGESISGFITVYHRGNQAGVQLKLEVDGVEPENLELDPGPVLFPDTEKEIPFTIHHSGAIYPPAGEHQLLFHVSAPDAYPGERATIAQLIQVEPIYQHTLRMLPMSTANI